MAPRRADEEIRRDVTSELEWDTRVEDSTIGVTVDDGVVTLTGTVTSFAKKQAAQEAAHRVPGVLDVANDIIVTITGGRARSDTEIARAVRDALEWDVLVPDDQIHSTVVNGWVTVEGTVDLLREREDAERVVRHLEGVRGVTNNISVSPPKVDPEVIRRAIETALERRAHREAERLEVAVADGLVALSGRVNSWAEKRAVLGAASHARGIRSVKDNLVVDPSI